MTELSGVVLAGENAVAYEDAVRLFLADKHLHACCAIDMHGEDTEKSAYHDSIVVLDSVDSVIGCTVMRQIFPQFALPVTYRLEQVVVDSHLIEAHQVVVLDEMIKMTKNVAPSSCILQLAAHPASISTWERVDFQHTHTLFPCERAAEAVFVYSQHPFCHKQMRKLDRRNPELLRIVSCCHAKDCTKLGTIPSGQVSL